MQLNAGLAASARRAASVFGLFALFADPALAGDRALIDFIGFSPDARYFAFEEFGIQDGSGFAYANIYVVDLATDSWLEGTPIRVRADDETKSLAAIRAEAGTKAHEIISERDISVPADIAALIGDGAPDARGDSLAFGLPGYAPGDVREERLVELSTFPATSPEDCETFFGTAPLGYELRLSGQVETMVLHRDEGDLPRSRGCPLDYRLHAVVLPWQVDSKAGVIIVSVYPGGFEGPDRRFLAVPFAF